MEKKSYSIIALLSTALLHAFLTYGQDAADSVSLQVKRVYNEGIAMYQEGDSEAAMSAYSRAIELNERFAEAWYNRGCLNVIKENYYGAINDFDQAILLETDYVNAYFNRAGAKKKLRHYADAIHDYTKATELNPYFADAFVNRGICKKLSGDYEGSAKDFEKAFEVDSTCFEAYNQLGILSAELREFQKAREFFDRSLQVRENKIALNNRGYVWLKLKRSEAAVEDLKKAVTIDPEYGTAWLNLGIAMEMVNDLDSACFSWEKSMRLGNTVAGSFFNLECEEKRK